MQDEVPLILKGYSKEVIRHSPEDIIKFSRLYFEELLKAEGYFNKHEDKKAEPAAPGKATAEAKGGAPKAKKEEGKHEEKQVENKKAE